MKRIILVLSMVVVFQMNFVSVVAQGQPAMSLEVAAAYRSGTRSMSGLPGSEYWQNRAVYQISAEVDVMQSTLSGEERVTYVNHSPDTLTKLVVRLYPDFFKKGNARSWPIGADDLTDGTQINSLSLNGTGVDLSNTGVVQRTATNMHVQLENPLLPNDSLIMEMDWFFSVPSKRQVRMGKYSENIMFVSYWYPQIAVYDDVDGWDELEYLGTVEFYNDFNTYNVTIHVPQDYKVWATGVLQNQKRYYTDRVIDRVEKARKSEEIITFFTAEDCRDGNVLRDKKVNDWHFIANKVPDFTFGLAREVNWQGSFVTVDSISGRKVLVDAVYPDSSVTFHRAAEWSAESVRLMSFKLPGIAFPYPHMTSFSNGRQRGGMESPMMAIDGDPLSESQAIGLFFHEISHTYFPFYMGANERKYAWMDEGFAAYFTNEIMEQEDPEYNYFERLVSTFNSLSGREREVPLIYLSYQINDYASYRMHAYNRSAMALAFLRDVLGDDVFKMSFQQFMHDWHGKHPIPYDFFNSIMQSTGQNLWWYFGPWYFDRAYADLGIKKVTFDNKVVIENVGKLPLPVQLTITFIDGSEDVVYRHTGDWKTNPTAMIVQVNPQKQIGKVVLGSASIPDVNTENNTMTPTYQ